MTLRELLEPTVLVLCKIGQPIQTFHQRPADSADYIARSFTDLMFEEGLFGANPPEHWQPQVQTTVEKTVKQILESAGLVVHSA